MLEINKRIITSIFLVISLFLAIYYEIFLFISLIFIFFQIFYEFQLILKKIIPHKKAFFTFLLLIVILSVLVILLTQIWVVLSGNNLSHKINLLFILSICISTDIGGFIFGKIFKGKKITKISPNKTYSGMLGSYTLSIITAFYFMSYLNYNYIILISIILSTISQIGDLFISLLKRKANLKDTGNILPGHGGLLDRFDGVIFTVPIGLIMLNFI
tara:strand:+ start:712 stop:1356 length:645 start_codon:yes stop_codon:yes gene_type:complete